MINNLYFATRQLITRAIEIVKKRKTCRTKNKQREREKTITA